MSSENKVLLSERGEHMVTTIIENADMGEVLDVEFYPESETAMLVVGTPDGEGQSIFLSSTGIKALIATLTGQEAEVDRPMPELIVGHKYRIEGPAVITLFDETVELEELQQGDVVALVSERPDGVGDVIVRSVGGESFSYVRATSLVLLEETLSEGDLVRAVEGHGEEDGTLHRWEAGALARVTRFYRDYGRSFVDVEWLDDRVQAGTAGTGWHASRFVRVDDHDLTADDAAALLSRMVSA